MRKLDRVAAEWTENGKLAFGAASEGMVARRCYAIEPAGLGCRVTLEENLKLKGAMAEFVALDLLRKVKQRNIEEDPKNLKKNVERNLSPS